MAQIKVIDVVRILKSRGLSVKYKKRSDGGILITQIGSQKFKAAKGNIRGREIAGVELSAGRKEQLTLAAKHHRAGISAKTYDPDKEVKKLQRRINRKRRKYNIEGGGIVTKSKIKYWEEHYGKKALIDILNQQERYAEGLAYDKNISHLIARFDELYTLTGNVKYQECAELIKLNAGRFKEEWIQPIYYDILNKIDSQEITPNEALNMLQMMIR